MARTSYAQTINSDAAAVVFPGGAAGSWTLSFWFRAGLVEAPILTVDASGEAAPSLVIEVQALGLDFTATNDAETPIGLAYTTVLGADWNHFAVTCDGSELKVYHEGVYINNLLLSGTFAARERLLVGTDDTDSPDFDLAQLALFSRVLLADEIASLHTAGRGHDLRESVGDYVGGVSGPQHWYPADRLFKSFVIDRGLAGTCPLELFGLAARKWEEA